MKKLLFAIMVLISSTNVQSQILSSLPDGTVSNNTHFAGVEIVGGVKTSYKYSIASLTALIGGSFSSVNIGNSDLALPIGAVTRQLNLVGGTFKLFKMGNFTGINNTNDTVFNFNGSTGCYFNKKIWMQSLLRTSVFTWDSVVLDNNSNRIAMDLPHGIFGILGHQYNGNATNDIRGGFKILPSGAVKIEFAGDFNHITITPRAGDGSNRDFTTPSRSGEFALAGDGLLPNIILGPGAGTGSSIIAQDGDDRSGTVYFITGTGCTIGSLIFRVTYNQTYTTNTRVVLMPKTTNSALVMSASLLYVLDDQPNYFDLNCGGTPATPLADHTQYYFNYVVTK